MNYSDDERSFETVVQWTAEDRLASAAHFARKGQEILTEEYSDRREQAEAAELASLDPMDSDRRRRARQQQRGGLPIQD